MNSIRIPYEFKLFSYTKVNRVCIRKQLVFVYESESFLYTKVDRFRIRKLFVFLGVM